MRELFGTRADYMACAEKNFLNGYNCAQSVAVAYAPLCGLDARTAAAAVHGFGGGFGRMREVCGTVCGGIFVLNMMFADEDDSPQKKRAHYARVQQFMRLFEAQEGSYLCRVLLGVSGPESPVPEARTESYYQKRPCPALCAAAAGFVWDILEKAHKSQPTTSSETL